MSCRHLRARCGVLIRRGDRNRLCQQRGIGERGRSRRRCDWLVAGVEIVEAVAHEVAWVVGRSRSFGVVVGKQRNCGVGEGGPGILVEHIGFAVAGAVELVRVLEVVACSRKRAAEGDRRFGRLLRGWEVGASVVCVIFVVPRVFVPPRARRQRIGLWTCYGLYADHVWRNVSEIDLASSDLAQRVGKGRKGMLTQGGHRDYSLCYKPLRESTGLKRDPRVTDEIWLSAMRIYTRYEIVCRVYNVCLSLIEIIWRWGVVFYVLKYE